MVRNKALLSKEFHLQPSEIDRMPFWEYEIFMEELNEIIKEENKKQEKENAKYSHMSPDSMMKSAGKTFGSSMPKMPSMPSMPSMHI